MIIVGIIIWVVLMVVILRFFQVASEPINELEDKQKTTMTTVIKQDDLEFSPFEIIGLIFEGTNDTFQVIASSENDLNVILYKGSSEEQANWVYESLVKGGNQ